MSGRVVILAVAVFLLAASSHLVNDIVDLPADRTNRPRRPLPSGALEPARTRGIAVLALGAGLILGLLFWPWWWAWWLFWGLAGPGYSLFAKGHGWRAPLWTAAVIASCFLAGAGSNGYGVLDVILFMSIYYYIFFREFVKNLEDAAGDRIAGYRTFAGGRWDRWPVVLILALPLVGVGAITTLAQPSGSWSQIAGAAFLLCLLVALGCLPASRWYHRHLSGSWLKGGAFCGLGLILGLAA